MIRPEVTDKWTAIGLVTLIFNLFIVQVFGAWYFKEAAFLPSLKIVDFS